MTGDPNSARRTLEKTLNEVVRLPDHHLFSVQTSLDSYLYSYRALFAIAGFLGVLALALTVSGIFGVCSYTVVQRKRNSEFEWRLGAGQARVTGMVLWQSLRLAAAGAGIGTLAALALARVTAHYGWYGAGMAFSMRQLDVFDPGRLHRRRAGGNGGGDRFRLGPSEAGRERGPGANTALRLK